MTKKLKTMRGDFDHVQQKTMVIQYLDQRMSLRDVGEKIHVSLRQVQKLCIELENEGYVKNYRPGKALTWAPTPEGIAWLEKEKGNGKHIYT